MFAKLLKHEFKATAGLLGILSAAALGVGVLGGFMLRVNTDTPAMTESYEVWSIISAIALPFIFISLFAYAFGSGIYLIVRFYKNKFTDQGYLTFTLPVRAWQIYLSSLLNMMFWSVIISITAIVAFVCVYFIGIYDTVVWHELQNLPLDMTEIWDSMFSEFGGFSWMYPVVSFVSGNVLTITSVTLGCVLAKKHKVLASIGCYYGITMVTGAVTTWLSSLILIASEEIQLDLIFLPSTLVQFAAILVGSLLTIWLMDKKLNLP